MLLLGLVLLIALAALTIGVIAEGQETVRFTGLGLDLDTSAATLFLVGLVVGILALLSVAMMGRGARRSANRRREVRSLRREAAATGDVETEKRRLAEERERLERERSRLRGETDTSGSHEAGRTEPGPSEHPR
jgi:hypothetical protein